jgi:hypothetical protein
VLNLTGVPQISSACAASQPAPTGAFTPTDPLTICCRYL